MARTEFEPMGPSTRPSMERKREREREGPCGGGGGQGRTRPGGRRTSRRVPRASRTINHRGNSIDGCWLLQGASDACQTRLVPCLPNNLRKRPCYPSSLRAFESRSLRICVILHARNPSFSNKLPDTIIVHAVSDVV